MPRFDSRFSLTCLLVAAFFALAACSSGEVGIVESTQVEPQLPSPIWDGLDLGMTRSEISGRRAIRVSRPAGGRNPRIWVYARRGEHSVQLTFSGRSAASRLERIDVRFGLRSTPADRFIARYEERFGPPDIRRRRAITASFGGGRHDQFDTIWSDDTRYVYITEKAPKQGRTGRTAFYLTVKKKEITAAGPPTGYVPPPPPEGTAGSDDDPFL